MIGLLHTKIIITTTDLLTFVVPYSALSSSGSQPTLDLSNVEAISFKKRWLHVFDNERISLVL